MPKIIIILVLIFITNIGFCQENKNELKTYDPKLVGCWKGSEIGQEIKGVSKYWVSCRYSDGTSILLFVAIDEHGEVKQTTGNGRWWTENGKYYEFHNSDGITDIYKYDATEEHINFQSIELYGFENSSYKFTDYKIEED